MSDSKKNTYETLEDSVLIEMAFGSPEAGSESYDDMIIEKLSLEKIKKNIDRTTGAPGNVRFSVGAAQSPEDKLATLQVFYPDAMRVEDLDPQSGAMEFGYGNFAFTNPETGKLTLYDEFNPKFLGIPIPTGRDFLDVGPEVAETAGAIGGLIGGGYAGVYTTAPTGGLANPVTMAIAGEGLGSATARELYIGMGDIFGETVDSRNLGERAVDFTQTATFNAAAGPVLSKTWQGIKYVGGQPIKYMTGGVSPNAQQTLEAFDSVGISNPTAGQITTNPTLNMIESGLVNMPPSTKIMHQNAAQTIEEINIFTKELAKKYGGVRTTDEAGLALMTGARQARQRYTNEVDKLYNKVNLGMDPNIASEAKHTQEFVKKYLAQSKTATGEDTLKPAMEMAAKLLHDADAGVLNYNTLKNFRTYMRENEASSVAAGAKLDAAGRKMKELYGYVSQDLADLVDTAGNDVSQLAFREANEYVAKMQKNTIGSITYLDNVIAKGEVEANKALKYVLTGAKDGGESLAKLKSVMDPDEFNVISGYMLGRMGLPTPGMTSAADLGEELIVKEGAEFLAEKGFSPRRFKNNYETLSKEAKDVMFRGTEYEDLIPELDNLVFTAKKIGIAAEQMSNPSGTARNISTALFPSGAGGGAVGGGFDFGIGALAAPWLSAKLFTNKDFVRWLAEGVEQVAYDPNSYAQHVRRLYQIYEVNPEIREEVRAVLEGMQFETVEEIEDRNADNVPPVTTPVKNEQAFREVSNAEVSGKLLPEVRLADQIISFETPQVSDPEMLMSPSILPNEKDREIAMRDMGGIGSLA